MKVSKFEKRIQHLSQEAVLTGAVSVLNKLLVQKGIVTKKELQECFLEWMKFVKENTKVKIKKWG